MCVFIILQGLMPYDENAAKGMRILHNLLQKGCNVEGDTYWAHAPLSREERADIVLVTDRCVLGKLIILLLELTVKTALEWNCHLLQAWHSVNCLQVANFCKRERGKSLLYFQA